MKFLTFAALAFSSVFAQEDVQDQDLYKCNPEEYKCEICTPPNTIGCNFKTPCEKTCGKFTPEDLLGVWRGFMVKDHAPSNFTMGEFRFEFGETDLTVMVPDFTKHMYDVATVAGDTFAITSKETNETLHFSNSLVENLEYTQAMGISTEFSNTTYPISWTDSIKRNDSLTFTLFQCNRWAPGHTCEFNILPPVVEEKTLPTIPIIQDDDKKYKCTWNTNPPKCVEDPDGTLTLEECQNQCHNAQYGKCNYLLNKCEQCKPANTPGGDPDCIYLMSYCTDIQKEGKCVRSELQGLYRMIESRIGYSIGEYDIQLGDGKIYIQSYQVGKSGNGFGQLKVDNLAQTFHVENWVGDDRIWTHDEMYGAFKMIAGEQQVFQFLELAISDQPITKIEEGLNGRLFAGFGCKDPAVCNFAKASPHPGFWSFRQQSPAFKEAFFLQ